MRHKGLEAPMNNYKGCFVRIIGVFIGAGCIVPSLLILQHLHLTCSICGAIEAIIFICMVLFVLLTSFFAYNAITQIVFKGKYSFSEFWKHVIEFVNRAGEG